MDTTPALILVLCTAVSVILLFKPPRYLRPPGPGGLPLFGIVFQIPKTKQWIKFEEWSKKYGDIVLINVMGTPTLILGSLQAATDLLETRGVIYSDRPRAVMAGELVGWDRGLGYCRGPPSSRFRSFRRAFHTFIGPHEVNCPNIKRALEISSLKLVDKILRWDRRHPEDLVSLVRESTASLILRLSYGYDVDGHTAKDPLQLVQIAKDAMRGFARASEPGAYWVDNFPWLKFIPPWVPGTTFHRHAREMRADLERLYDTPHAYVKRCMADGSFIPSFVSTYLEQLTMTGSTENNAGFELLSKDPDQGEEFIKAAAASLYSGGEETTPSSVMSFILAMVLFPEVQARAQAELDEVFASHVPTFEDIPKLPYIRAMVTELWRWGVSVPLGESRPVTEGLPHVLIQDDVYRGYTIPKGTVVWANIWAMMHDESMFPEPGVFRPERYLGGDETSKKRAEAVRSAFGFGRRICPGVHLAEQSLFIAVATMLFFLRFSKAVDESGTIIEPEVEYDGFISHPRPFRCNIEGRLSRSEELLSQALLSHDPTFSLGS